MKKISIVFLTAIVLIVSMVVSCKKDVSATCSDGIHNQNETRIDCGGPCSPCGTCSDGILNQDEVNVDCGGVCSKCATCSDGIQNQNETGIDCGGPCNNCPIVYPKDGTYENILRKDTVIIVGHPTPFNQDSYSMSVQLPEQATVKIIMNFTPLPTTTITTFGPWYHNSSVGWIITPYSSSTKTHQFVASGKGTYNLNIGFIDHGKAIIDIYEYGATVPTRSKALLW